MFVNDTITTKHGGRSVWREFDRIRSYTTNVTAVYDENKIIMHGLCQRPYSFVLG